MWYTKNPKKKLFQIQVLTSAIETLERLRSQLMKEFYCPESGHTDWVRGVIDKLSVLEKDAAEE